ncbi:major facilitator superfamily MFS_1 [Ferrimonas balearica DSM 9799]|uniref:Major facilitator superfamily MFS_1 n=1 Tax=Ferrimonas balearica (strain DSM 9799 / CCM 4581 / KCTC 23876 / PAT) TaxID=550540 RepID=E1SQ50_FERBD|nr:MFS transporter [Ferrimonas balearica]ADN76822.1 major facilitator superfamily MFS_1 [Ferrimonas balearica DSM 9799]
MSALLEGRQRKALAASYFAFYAILGLMVPYLSLYLDHLGFNSAQIGWMLAILFATRMIAPNIWAALSDRLGTPVRIIRAGALLAAFTYLGLFVAKEFLVLAVVMGIYTFFWNAILAQLEVVTLTTLADRPQDYGGLRSFGSVGYIVLVVGAGWWFGLRGPADLPWVGLVLFLALLGASMALTEVAPRVRNEAETDIPFMSQLLQRPVLLFLLAAMLMQGSHGPFYTFYVLYLRGLGLGESTAGILVAVGVLAEIGIFLLAPRLLGRFSVRTLMALCCVMTSLRWVLTDAAGTSVLGHGVAQLLHAFSFGLAHACGIQFVHRNFSAAHQGKAQALYASVSFGLGGAIGAYISGQLWHNGAGASLTWTLAAVAAASALVALLLMGREQDGRRR